MNIVSGRVVMRSGQTDGRMVVQGTSICARKCTSSIYKVLATLMMQQLWLICWLNWFWVNASTGLSSVRNLMWLISGTSAAWSFHLSRIKRGSLQWHVTDVSVLQYFLLPLTPIISLSSNKVPSSGATWKCIIQLQCYSRKTMLTHMKHRPPTIRRRFL